MPPEKSVGGVRIPSSRGPKAAAPATPLQAAFGAALRAQSSPPWLTRAIILANLAVFVGMWLGMDDVFSPSGESLLHWGANYGPLTRGGEPWRLWSSMFVHAGPIHLGFNLYALWLVGRFAERLYGHLNYAFLYLFAGTCGSLASVMVNPNSPSVGASGAIFGVFGATLAFLVWRRNHLLTAPAKTLRNRMLSVIVLNVFLGFAIPEIDQAAHIGGLLGGAFAGVLLAPKMLLLEDAQARDQGLLHRPIWSMLPLSLGVGGLLWLWM